MTKPSKSSNLKHIKKYAVLKQKILPLLNTNDLDLKNKAATPKISSCTCLNKTIINQNASFISEWKKWLFHCVNVNVCGKDISGILIQIHPDHLTLVNEFNVYIIPIQHVTFICKSFKR